MGDLVWSHGPRYFGTVRKEKYIYMHALLLLLLLLLFMIYEKVEFIQTEIGIQ